MEIDIVTKNFLKTKKMNPVEKSAYDNVYLRYPFILHEMRIRRKITLYICDQWAWLIYQQPPKSLGGYYPGNKFLGRLGKVDEHILLKLSAFSKKNQYTKGNWENIVKHELIHAKLRSSPDQHEHGPQFKQLEKQLGVKTCEYID